MPSRMDYIDAALEALRVVLPNDPPLRIVLQEILIVIGAGWLEDTCEFLKVPENEMTFCGMALGHANEAAAVNALVSGRSAPEEFVAIRENTVSCGIRSAWRPERFPR